MKALELHGTIAWDIDGTLIGHRNSAALRDWIRSTRDRRHIVVTFRPGPLLDRLKEDLEAASPGIWSCFSGVISPPVQERLGGLILPDSAAATEFRNWKGLACVRAGASVLIDDDTLNTAPGCLIHGVTLFHPDDFSPTTASALPDAAV